MPLREVAARLLVCACLVCACSSPPSRVDAGRDASPDAEAGRDGGRDAGPDAGRDAGTQDAGRDAGPDAGPRDGGPGDPGWVALPGLPAECRIERATYPERLWDLTWAPCTDDAGAVVSGCQVGRGAITGIVGAWHQSGQTWLRMLGGSFAVGRIVAIAPVDGPIVAAWREPPRLDDGIYCAVTAVAVGGGRAAFAAQFSDFVDMTRSRAWLYVATPDTIGATTEPVWEFPAAFVPRDVTIVHLWITSELLALQTSPGGTLYTYRDGEWQTLTGWGTVPGIPQGVHLVGDHLLWEAWQGVDDVRLVHARWGEAASLWRDVSPGATKGFGTDGVDLAWFENFDRQPDGTYARTELWTAPYRRDIELATPRIVRTMDQRSNRPAVGGGWVARRRLDPQRVEVFSLRDGARRTFIAPGGLVLEDPYYASEREIMFPGRGTIRFDPSILPVDSEP